LSGVRTGVETTATESAKTGIASALATVQIANEARLNLFQDNVVKIVFSRLNEWKSVCQLLGKQWNDAGKNYQPAQNTPRT